MNDELLTGIDLSKITPMMQQYITTKKKWMDCILFFRLGDFYEMFFDDAVATSKILELALTGRDCGLEKRAPMCGIPYHASESYIQKLISKGYKVAICEQVEDVSASKGIVRREVIKVITPGTNTDIKVMDAKSNNYIACIFKISNLYGLSFADITTGTIDASDIIIGDTKGKITDEIIKRNPSEIVCNSAFANSDELKKIKNIKDIMVSEIEEDLFSKDIFLSYYPDIKPENKLWTHSVAGLIEYIKKTQNFVPGHLKKINVYTVEEFMHMDIVARNNLEITRNLRDGGKRGSLLWVVDKTQTAMGGRLLRKYFEQPLLNKVEINNRLDAVEEIKTKYMQRQEIREILSGINDIERLSGKISLNSINARDLISLKNSLQKLPELKNCIANLNSFLWMDIYEKFDMMDDIKILINDSISDDPPISIKEGNIIKPEYNEEIKNLKDASINGKKWILDYEARERENSKIKNLKIKYTNNFGFLIEISNANKTAVPDHFIRRQTLVNCERYITDELKEMEEKILGSEQKLIALEYDIFCEIRSIINNSSERLFNISRILSNIDVLSSLGEISDRNNYCRPVVDNSDLIKIEEGRHPVVEKVLPQGGFVPNSTTMDENENRVLLITGPNMGGKSTFMRQTAQIVILAQIGCFVPAKSAHIGLVDKIFTRIGAADDLSSGQSTFMVEMNEVSYILKNATKKSLLILDEIGRGTSTYDGLSIAWAVMEHICLSHKLGCKALFATHYHELIGLEQTMEGLINYHVQADQADGDIVFLHKILKGGCDDSYGIDVAKLAGLPEEVINRAREILTVLEKDTSKNQLRIKKGTRIMEGQVDIFTSSLALKKTDSIIDELKLIDVQKMTPLDAMNLLYELSNRAKNIKDL